MIKLPTIDTKHLMDYITGKNKQPEIYEKLILSLHDLGIEAMLISFVHRSESHCAVKRGVVPFLTIHVKTNENYVSLNIDDHANNWDSTYPKTNMIRQMWHDLLIKYGFYSNDTYDKNMFVFFRNVPKCIINLLVYENRDTIIQSVGRLHVVQPKEIYCCSTPGYNVIYANEADYVYAEHNRQFNKIRSVIKGAITAKTPSEYQHNVENFLRTKFFHPKMPGFNWYGFARQD